MRPQFARHCWLHHRDVFRACCGPHCAVELLLRLFKQTQAQSPGVQYTAWLAKHAPECQKNIDGKAGQTVVPVALCMFQSSLDKYKLCYTTMLFHGDSSTFHALTEKSVYGFIKVEKRTVSTMSTSTWEQPCVGLLTKRRLKVSHSDEKDISPRTK